MSADIRWKQRLQNWNKALTQLRRFMDRKILNELEEQGLIQSFEYNHELAWNVQKDFLQANGHVALYGSKDVAREAFARDLVSDGELWLDMIESRNMSSHSYNEETTRAIIAAIIDDYFQAFVALNDKLNQIAADD